MNVRKQGEPKSLSGSGASKRKKSGEELAFKISPLSLPQAPEVGGGLRGRCSLGSLGYRWFDIFNPLVFINIINIFNNEIMCNFNYINHALICIIEPIVIKDLLYFANGVRCGNHIFTALRVPINLDLTLCIHNL